MSSPTMIRMLGLAFAEFSRQHNDNRPIKTADENDLRMVHPRESGRENGSGTAGHSPAGNSIDAREVANLRPTECNWKPAAVAAEPGRLAHTPPDEQALIGWCQLRAVVILDWIFTAIIRRKLFLASHLRLPLLLVGRCQVRKVRSESLLC